MIKKSIKEKVLEQSLTIKDYEAKNVTLGEVVDDISIRVINQSIDLTLQELKKEIEEFKKKLQKERTDIYPNLDGKMMFESDDTGEYIHYDYINDGLKELKQRLEIKSKKYRYQKVRCPSFRGGEVFKRVKDEENEL